VILREQYVHQSEEYGGSSNGDENEDEMSSEDCEEESLSNSQAAALDKRLLGKQYIINENGVL
jgi:hypothetical protein